METASFLSQTAKVIIDNGYWRTETGKKKHLTAEEQTLRRSEVARRRKNQSIQRAEKDKVGRIGSWKACPNTLTLHAYIARYDQQVTEETSLEKSKDYQRWYGWRERNSSVATGGIDQRPSSAKIRQQSWGKLFRNTERIHSRTGFRDWPQVNKGLSLGNKRIGDKRFVPPLVDQHRNLLHSVKYLGVKMRRSTLQGKVGKQCALWNITELWRHRRIRQVFY